MYGRDEVDDEGFVDVGVIHLFGLLISDSLVQNVMIDPHYYAYDTKYINYSLKIFSRRDKFCQFPSGESKITKDCSTRLRTGFYMHSLISAYIRTQRIMMIDFVKQISTSFLVRY